MESASNSKPDSELVAEFRAGDGTLRQTAFRALYERHAGPIRSYLARRCRHEQLAEDLTQDCFLKALKGLDQFDSRSTVRTWLYCIATNLFRDQTRPAHESLDPGPYWPSDPMVPRGTSDS